MSTSKRRSSARRKKERDPLDVMFEKMLKATFIAGLASHLKKQGINIDQYMGSLTVIDKGEVVGRLQEAIYNINQGKHEEARKILVETIERLSVQ